MLESPCQHLLAGYASFLLGVRSWGMASRTRVTQAQVAKRAGVSRTVASFVLNNRTDQRVSEATAQRVRAVAEELGYRPNAVANILRTGRSGTLAIISDLITTTAPAADMVLGAIEGAREHGKLLFTAETMIDEATEERIITNLLDRQVEGVLYASMFTRELSLPPSLAGQSVVLLNCLDPSCPYPSVLPDEREGGRQAARILVEAGRASLVLFVGTLPGGASATSDWPDTKPIALRRRLEGIREVLATTDSRLVTDPLSEARWDPPTGRESVLRALRRGVRPSASYVRMTHWRWVRIRPWMMRVCRFRATLLLCRLMVRRSLGGCLLD
ncbi:LacI family transcriptional regulator [Actinomyces ruminis]|uniref:LacI family transcriptional regulator n=1 Tax=Actinomyces ruminis TaxID=1937003 RepID=A0ABX4MA84_9ACTO|nr:LacI family transcriptional regulator [Actinomyces ruminis]